MKEKTTQKSIKQLKYYFLHINEMSAKTLKLNIEVIKKEF